MRKRNRSKSQIKSYHAERVLNIYEGKRKLSQAELAIVIQNISDADFDLIARGDWKELLSAGIKGNCVFTGFYVGAVCLAKKYGKYGLRQDPKCKSCRADEIVTHLNYIFNKNYEGKYRAMWREKRGYRKKK